MAVLIRQKSSNSRTRTCNARCYNAKHNTCICICNHTNHGVGLQKAIENTEKIINERAFSQFSEEEKREMEIISVVDMFTGSIKMINLAKQIEKASDDIE